MGLPFILERVLNICRFREDLVDFCEGEFESIFIEATSGKEITIVGEVCRIPNTDQEMSIKRYENILAKINPKHNSKF